MECLAGLVAFGTGAALAWAGARLLLSLIFDLGFERAPSYLPESDVSWISLPAGSTSVTPASSSTARTE